jgi:hypothetical protein
LTGELEIEEGQRNANVAHGTESGRQVEHLLSNIDEELQSFPQHQDLLLQPNIWIGDTTATVHMSPYDKEMVNLRKTKGGITVGNGEVMVTKKIGDIPCDMCDRYKNAKKSLARSQM